MVREVIAREEALKQRVRDLKIEIDQVKRAKEVAQITESDYFSEVQKKLKPIASDRPNQIILNQIIPSPIPLIHQIHLLNITNSKCVL